MGRGISADTQRIIDATNAILAEMAPMTIRGICYQLFTQKLIPSMGEDETKDISRILRDARKNGLVKWSDIV